MSARRERSSARQAAQLTFLLDALGGVPVSVAEHQSLEWLAGWEIHTVQNIAAVLRRARCSPAQPDPPAPGDRVTRAQWHDRQGDLLELLDDHGDPDGSSPHGCRAGTTGDGAQ